MARTATLASMIRGTTTLRSLIGTKDSEDMDSLTERLIRTTDELLENRR